MFYKIYFWFYLILSSLMMLSLINFTNPWFLILLSSELILLTALYSNAYKKDFFSKTFWKIFFIYTILIGITSMSFDIIQVIKSGANSDLTIGLIVVSVMTILTIPAYISLYIYVFKKRKVSFKINKSLLWKIYFWFLLIASMCAVQGFIGNLDIIDLLISVIALLGLYAFCWNKKILNQVFWKIFFLATIVWAIISTYILPLPPQLVEKITERGMTISQPIIYLSATFGLILTLPLFLALYSYAFKSEGIWKSEKEM